MKNTAGTGTGIGRILMYAKTLSKGFTSAGLGEEI
jgi:hypothetical protein